VTKTIYLTFDDGPHEHVTPQVLAELKARGMAATFFQQGWRVARFPELTRRVKEEGHLVGNHAWTHPNLAMVDDDQLEAELVGTSAMIERACGERPRVFRPPYGNLGESELDRDRVLTWVRALGMRSFHWHLDSYDYTRIPADEIVRNVVDHARPRKVLLLHDNLENTGSAIGAILDELARRRYVSEVLPPNAELFPWDSRSRRRIA
jgi:peptidoglycan-N-acetylglucosamine deacetylase